MKISSILNFANMLLFRMVLSIIIFILSKYIDYKNIFQALSIILLGYHIILEIIKEKKINEILGTLIAIIILFIMGYTKISYITMFIIVIEKKIYEFLEDEEHNTKMSIYQILSIFLSIILIIIYLSTKNKEMLLLTSVILLSQNYILFNLINIKNRKKTIKDLNNDKIYLKNEKLLTKISKIKNIIFNKTGTLTSGKLRVTKVITDNIDEFFYYLNNAEYNSNSIFKDTIYKYRKSRIDKAKIKNYKEVDGGISVTINKRKVLAGNYYLMKKNKIEIEKNIEQATIIYLAVDNKYLGSIAISDSIKTKQKIAIEELKKNKNIYIISGDNDKITNAVSTEYKIKDKYSNATSFEKEFWLVYLKNKVKGIFAIVDNDMPYSSSNKDIKIRINKENKNIDDNDIIIVNDDIKNIVTLIKKANYYNNTRIVNAIITTLIKIFSIYIIIRFNLNVLTMFIFELINLIICIIVLERGLIYEQYRNFKQL